MATKTQVDSSQTGGSTYSTTAGHMGTTDTSSQGYQARSPTDPRSLSNQPSDLDFVARAASSISAAKERGWNVFQFQNTLSDALVNGTLQGADMGNPTALLTSLPSQWRSAFAMNPEALDNLLGDVNRLVGVARSIWSSPQAAGPGSAWLGIPASDSYLNHISTSTQGNAGTEKDGYADHPDYVGKLGTAIAEGYGIYKTGTASMNLANAGIDSLAAGEAEAVSLGETVLGAVPGIVGEGGMMAAMGAGEATLAAVGTATGVAEVAVAGIGLAAVGYGLYKLCGGAGNVPFLDNVGSKLESTFDVFSSFLP